MLARLSIVWCAFALVSMTTEGMAQSPSPTDVKTLNPPGAISTGTDAWSVGARAGDFIFVAGMTRSLTVYSQIGYWRAASQYPLSRLATMQQTCLTGPSWVTDGHGRRHIAMSAFPESGHLTTQRTSGFGP
jgi:hypothetical protein